MDSCVAVGEETECEENDSGSNSPIPKEEETFSKKVLRIFIETYEAHPELWDSTEKNYKNQLKRNLAVDKLLKIYREVKPGAKRDDVRRKINSLRSNYRKELKKIAVSKSENATEVHYQSTSWVFHALRFLDRRAQPLRTKPKMNQIALNDQPQTTASTQTENTIVVQDLGKQSMASLSSSRSLIAMPLPTAKRQRVVEPVAEKLKEPEDYVPTIVKVWAEKLLDLDQQQRSFAEKAITDVLFEAALGNLNRYSVKINEDIHDRRDPSVLYLPSTPRSVSSLKSLAGDMKVQDF